MNKKTINKVIEKKMNQWLDSIDNLELLEQMKKDIIVTGGCVASMLLNEDVNDFDVYFRTKETTKRVAVYYCNKFNANNNMSGGEAYVLDGADRTEEEKTCGAVMLRNMDDDRIKIIITSAGVAASDDFNELLDAPFENVVDALSEADDLSSKLLDTPKMKELYRPVFLSSNAITLSGKVQAIIRFHGDPEEIHKNYDFAHCTNYWTFNGGVVLNQPAIEALLARELIYCGSKYPLCSIIRTRKFIKRGFRINAGQYLKMCFQVSELDLTDIDVLEDQLVGVDSAYFSMLINGLRAKMESDPSFKIEDGYISSIIDKIF